MALLNMLSTGRKHGGMTVEQKHFVLDAIEEGKSLDYTRSVMMALHVRLRAEIGRIEALLDAPNPSMRLLLELLRV